MNRKSTNKQWRIAMIGALVALFTLPAAPGLMAQEGEKPEQETGSGNGSGTESDGTQTGSVRESKTNSGGGRLGGFITKGSEHPFDSGISFLLMNNSRDPLGVAIYESMGLATAINLNEAINTMPLFFGGSPSINLNPQIKYADAHSPIIERGINLGFLFGSGESRSHRGKFFISYADSLNKTPGARYHSSASEISFSTMQIQSSSRHLEHVDFDSFKHAELGYYHDIFAFSSSSDPILAGLGFRIGLNVIGDSYDAMLIRNSQNVTVMTDTDTGDSTAMAYQNTLPGKESFAQGHAYGIVGLVYSLAFLDDHTLDLVYEYRQGKGAGSISTETVSYESPGFFDPTGSMRIPSVVSGGYDFDSEMTGSLAEISYHYKLSKGFSLGASYGVESMKVSISNIKSKQGTGMGFIGMTPNIETNSKLVGFDFRLLY